MTAMRYFAVLLVAVGVGVGGFYLHAQKTPVTVSETDMLKLKLAQSQLENIQVRYQNEAAAVLKERDGIMGLYCSKAGYTYGPQGNCTINEKGEIFKMTAQPTAPKK